MRILEVVVLILLVSALGFSLYNLSLIFPGESEAYNSFQANESNSITDEISANVPDKIIQFYPNMRYPDRKISYSLSSACPSQKWETIERAFAILSERTVLDFYRSSDSPEISVLCSEISPESNETGHFIAGEGGPSEIINTGNFAVILNGRISLYRPEKCDEPNVAIHEILHALGFDHYNSADSIMYPVTGCNQQIDDEIISDINKLYSFDSLPDLEIESLSANKMGRYLNFDINVSNIGLSEAKNANLIIYADNKRITNFTLEDLDVGVKRILSVQNVRISSSSDNLVFVVDSDDSRELTLSNNRVEISLV